jgi:parallel beta-helix repeat protein
MSMKRFLGILLIPLLLVRCTDKYNPERTFSDGAESIELQFLTATDSSIIELPEGHYLFDRSLILDGVAQVTIRGAGIDKTVLSFLDQSEGAEGIRVVNSENIVLEGLTVEDALGDNIKVMDTDGIVFRKVKVAWTGPIDKTNGAYGFYPVLCTNVLIEDCEAMGSSDAGIYVGQSDSVIIRRNKAYQNVAGIESENSRWVKIYDNDAYDNTGGILVFDLPGLTQFGKDIEVFDNRVKDNNRDNFAPEGNIVAAVPPGTGVMILATENVHVHDNVIDQNKTIGTAIISYVLVSELTGENNSTETNAGSAQQINRKYEEDEKYNPYSRNIRLENNEIKNDHMFPSLSHDFGRLFVLKFGVETPDIIYDGILPPGIESRAALKNSEYRICLNEAMSTRFADMDAGNGFEAIGHDKSVFACD